MGAVRLHRRIFRAAAALFDRTIVEGYALLLVFSHRDVPAGIKLFALLPIAYIFSPLDLVPDSIPFAGQMDDLFIIRLAYLVLVQFVPKRILDDARATAREVLGRGKRRVFMIVFVAGLVVSASALSFGIWYLHRTFGRGLSG